MLFLCVPLAGYSPWGHKESDTTERLITHAYWVISPCYKLFIEMTSDICAKLLQSCPTLCDPMDYSLPGSSVHGIFPGKNTGVGCHFPLQGIFLTQELNLSAFQTDYLLTELRGKPHLFIVLYLTSFWVGINIPTWGALEINTPTQNHLGNW